MKPDIVVLPEEIVGAVTPLTVKAGHELGIPSLIVPYTIANKQEPFQSLSNYPSYKYSLLPNRLVGSIFRRWVMRQDGVALVRMPATYILGQEFTRTAPPDPWMMNSGYADAIAVENEAMRDYYRAAGIPDGRMRVVGAIYDDTLAGYLNAKAIELPRLRSELGLAGDRPLLVVGGCPDQSGNCPDFEFDSMKVLAGRLVEALAVLRDDYDIVVRPHPNYPELGRLLGAQGLCITMTDTARLVALSDAYVAFGSATIRWAVACGVPTINYDVFRYDYDDFKEVGGVVTVSDYASFARAVAGLALGHPDGRALALRAAEDAPRWGMLDGGSADRIAALIEELCRRPVRRTGRGALHGQVQQEKP